MKAVLYERKDSSYGLTVRDIMKPVPGEGEILVKIHSVSVNAADYRSMKMGIIPEKKIYGTDVAGKVEELGKNTKKFSVGDNVFGDLSACGCGGFAEYVAVPESAVAKIPAGVPFETASAVPMSAVTALQALRDQGKVRPGQSVLIIGAGGGVGTFAVQLAKHFGAQVTAVCGGKNRDVIRDLGADRVVNYQEEDIALSGNRYDLVLAVNGKYSLSTYKRLLNPKGICVVVGGALSQVIKAMLFGAFLSMGGRKLKVLAAKPDVRDLEQVIGLVSEGKIRPVIDRMYPLGETADAVGYLAGGHASGKVVIRVVG